MYVCGQSVAYVEYYIARSSYMYYITRPPLSLKSQSVGRSVGATSNCPYRAQTDRQTDTRQPQTDDDDYLSPWFSFSLVPYTADSYSYTYMSSYEYIQCIGNRSARRRKRDEKEIEVGGDREARARGRLYEAGRKQQEVFARPTTRCCLSWTDGRTDGHAALRRRIDLSVCAIQPQTGRRYRRRSRTGGRASEEGNAVRLRRSQNTIDLSLRMG